MVVAELVGLVKYSFDIWHINPNTNKDPNPEIEIQTQKLRPSTFCTRSELLAWNNSSGGDVKLENPLSNVSMALIWEESGRWYWKKWISTMKEGVFNRRGYGWERGSRHGCGWERASKLEVWEREREREREREKGLGLRWKGFG